MEKTKSLLPGGESNPALARSAGVTGACTNPIYYQGLDKRAALAFIDLKIRFHRRLGSRCGLNTRSTLHSHNFEDAGDLGCVRKTRTGNCTLDVAVICRHEQLESDPMKPQHEA